MSLKDILRQAGFTGPALNMAYAIAMAESSGNARAFNGNTKTGDQSYGLFQINMLGGMGPERRKQFGLKSNDDLYDAVKNAQVAYKMSKGGTDWSPWSTYKRGSHKKYLSGSDTEVTGGTAPPAGVPGTAAPPASTAQPDIIGSGLGDDFAPSANGFDPQQRDFSQPAVKQQTLEAPDPSKGATSYQPTSGGSSLRDKAIAAAMSVLGTPYSWGGGTTKGASMGFGKGAGIRGFDCSSLMMFAYAQAGYSMPRTGRPQLALGKRVPISQLQPGDFLGWGDGHHIAMYLGNGKYIQAPSTGGHVEIKTLSKGSSAWGVHLNLPGD